MSVLRRTVVFCLYLLSLLSRFHVFLVSNHSSYSMKRKMSRCISLPFSLEVLGNQFCPMKLMKNSDIDSLCGDFQWGAHFSAFVLGWEFPAECGWFALLCGFFFRFMLLFFFLVPLTNKCKPTWYSFGLRGLWGGGCVWDRQERWSTNLKMKKKALLQQWSSMLLPYSSALEVLFVEK